MTADSSLHVEAVAPIADADGPADTALRISDVSYRYSGDDVVRHVSFDVRKGEFFCLLGPSGSGKSTLLSLISGLLTPSTGAIWLGSQNLVAVPTRRRNIGFVFQE